MAPQTKPTMSLLKKAQEIKARRRHGRENITEDDYELVLAFFDGQVTLTQVAKAKEIRPMSIYIYIVQVMQQMFADGIVATEEKP